MSEILVFECVECGARYPDHDDEPEHDGVEHLRTQLATVTRERDELAARVEKLDTAIADLSAALRRAREEFVHVAKLHVVRDRSLWPWTCVNGIDEAIWRADAALRSSRGEGGG